MTKLSFRILYIGLFIFLFVQINSNAQQRPRLVVGITVDQMRWDYLYRYQHRWHEKGGFKRMMDGGFQCNNTYITYTPTFTACGHTGIYTGSVPAIHGITGNEWYDQIKQDLVYCTDDNNVQTVGSSTTAGKMSPANLLTTTICDELKLATNFRSKTIGIAIKDRGGILAAGHSANASYWYDSKTGDWITSTYYMEALPTWVTNFNSKAKIDSLYNLNWNTLYPKETYVQSVSNKKSYEIRSFGGPAREFPYDLKSYAGTNYSIITATPHGNTLTTEFAKAALLGEEMGKDTICDFLAVSYSSPDYVGHSYGPNSMEIEDLYIRFDLELGAFFDFLDKQVGQGQYLVFLSADHGASHVPGFLKENKLPGGLVDDEKLIQGLNDALKAQFGVERLSLAIVNFQLLLNKAAIEKSNKLREDLISAAAISWLEKQPMISRAFRLDQLAQTTLPESLKTRVSNGYYPLRSGEIQIIYKPGYIEGFLNGGTTHGVWYPYDARIPLLWYGWGIPKGNLYRNIGMADIAPTLAALLKIQEPNGNVGHVITEILK
jgi:predicted AlkP superfamily pyrophosphatase or phosphodiesterase